MEAMTNKEWSILYSSCCWKSKERVFLDKLIKNGSICEEYQRYLDIAKYMVKNNLENIKVEVVIEEFLEEAIQNKEGFDSKYSYPVKKLCLLDSQMDLVNFFYVIKGYPLIEKSIFLRYNDIIIELEEILFNDFFTLESRQDILCLSKEFLKDSLESEIESKLLDIKILRSQVEELKHSFECLSNKS